MDRRYLYHAMPRDQPLDESYAPTSLVSDGFIHCSFAPQIHESVRLYLPHLDNVDVVQLDPNKLTAELRIEQTPRGPMPHLYGTFSKDALVSRTPFFELPTALPDAIETDLASR